MCMKREWEELGALPTWIQVLALSFILCGHRPQLINLSETQFLFRKIRGLIPSQGVGRVKKERAESTSHGAGAQ